MLFISSMKQLFLATHRLFRAVQCRWTLNWKHLSQDLFVDLTNKINLAHFISHMSPVWLALPQSLGNKAACWLLIATDPNDPTDQIDWLQPTATKFISGGSGHQLDLGFLRTHFLYVYNNSKKISRKNNFVHREGV